MVKLIQTIEEITETIVVEECESFLGEGAGSTPIIVLNGLSITIIPSCVILIKQDDVELLIQEIIGLQQGKEVRHEEREENRA